MTNIKGNELSVLESYQVEPFVSKVEIGALNTLKQLGATITQKYNSSISTIY